MSEPMGAPSAAYTPRLVVLDGPTVTARRTAAASALASQFLSRADASQLLMVGAEQAMAK